MESIGSDTFIYGHILETKLSLTARFPGKWQKENPEAKQVSVTVKPNSLHLFDVETGLRIVSES